MTMQEDRFIGALMGLAVGDALGAPLEFTSRDTLPELTGMRGGGSFRLDAGQWTDDTSMALCIASSLVETMTFDLRDQLTRFLRWRDEGYWSSTGRCFGVGRQTFWALIDFATTGAIARGKSRGRSAGNGSLMRLAPIPMVFANDPSMAARASAASSVTTHPAVECTDACAAYGRLLVGVNISAAGVH